MPRSVPVHHSRARVVAGSLCAAAAGIALIAAPGASAALTTVPQRVAFETNRIDSPESAALPDGRVLLGWVNGTNSGDTTLAMVRPAGGLLPSAPQVLRTGYAGEDVSFLTGGPSDAPAITYWEDGDSRTPFRVKLDGNLFTTQTAIFSGTYGTGRFPRYARCPDGTTLFAYQYTNINPPSPTTYASAAYTADAKGQITSGGAYATGGAPDYYQDPRVTCDRGVKLFSTSIAGDDQQGAVAPEHLRVLQLGAGGGTLLNTDSVAPHAYVSSPDARVASDGRVWILWTESPVNPTSDPKAYLATRAPGATGAATFSGTPFLSAPNTYAGPLFFDAAGNTHILIQHSTGPGTTTFGIRTAPPGSATFGPEQALPVPSNAYPQLLRDHPDGNPRLLLVTSDPTPPYAAHYALQGIPQAGSGDARTPIDFDGVDFATASFLPTGDLFLAGVHSVDSTHDQLVEGGLDSGTPPTLEGVDVPGLAAAGEATTIGVTAGDPMGLGSFTWTVTGGALASPVTLRDQQATIPGLQPGSYVVTARAVDRAGNASEVSRTMRVLDPNAVTPGSQAFADAVAKAGGTLTPADKTAPKFLSLTATRGKKGAAKRTVTVTLKANEAVAADADLLGKLSRGGQTGRLILRSSTINALSKAQPTGTVKLTIPASLARLVGNKLSVTVTLTDLGGNRAAQTVTVKTAKK